jgi:hypothetical protein
LLDVFVAYLGFAGSSRLLVFGADCDAAARAALVHERAELDLTTEVTIVGDAPAERYAAYRAAAVALAVGQPIDTQAAVTPLWFDIPIVSLGDPVAVETVEASGIVEDRFEPRRFAALLHLLASDAPLRAAICGEGRRVRERHAPRSVVATLFDGFAASVAPAARPIDARR